VFQVEKKKFWFFVVRMFRPPQEWDVMSGFLRRRMNPENRPAQRKPGNRQNSSAIQRPSASPTFDHSDVAHLFTMGERGE